MSNLYGAQAALLSEFGSKVSRATSNLPQTAQSALFNVLGGRVLVTGIVGTVTTAVQNQANNTKIVANPTTGGDVDMCTTLSIANKGVGTLFGIQAYGSAMIGAEAGAVPLPTSPIVVAVGTIDLNCAASNTGQVRWDIWYIPLDTGAYITAA